LQNYGVINFVQFFWTTLYIFTKSVKRATFKNRGMVIIQIDLTWS